ncbi:eb263f51-3ac3-4776-8ee1-7e92f08e4ad1 [Sclerotinia trifoliorum]|uniref:Eb263f51-3ac3-4776-8ee1-7e92f08e4ad1 n=1 Tax=Sclerotinia trifoliorum TaxID=28548 RepID=A0A8H2ZQZ9_9HELO|nr:eb263f51-3ac3-4776-8ee1-7e92f08e4ad1 [Sclerotinia trifoliorum]
MSRVTNSVKINIAEDNTASIAAQIPLPLTPASKVLATSNAHGLNTMALHESEDMDLAQHMKNLKAAYRSALGITKKGKKHNKNKTKGKQEYSSEIEHTKDIIQEVEGSESIVGHSNSIQATPNTGSVSGIIANPPGVRPEMPMSNSESPRILTDQLRSVQPLQIMEQAMFHQLPQSGRITRGQVARQQAAMKNSVKTETKNIESFTAEKLRSISNENDRPAISVKYPLTKQVKTLEQIERAYEAKEAATPARHSSSAGVEEDSFIDIIISRSPAKPVSRIEDSLEELDNLEDAIDALDEATTVEKFVATSTKKVTIPTEVSSESDSRESLRRGFIEEIPATGLRVRVRGTLSSSQRPKSTYATVRVKPTATKEPTLKKAKSMTFESSRPIVSPEKQTMVSPSKVPRPASLLPPKSPTKSTKPPTKAIFELPGDAVAKRLKEQREARIAQRESSEMTIVKTTPGRIKSTKPPTKSSQFELPGEAYSRRKREAHEARVKAQEEEDRKRREFKARPMSKFVASRTLPRDTAASRARQSKTGGESSDTSGLTLSKRGSIVGAHRPSILDMQKVNVTSSSPRTKAPPAPLTRKASSHPHNPRVTMQRTVSDSDQESQRQRAKELYNRDAQYTAEIEKEKKDREAAAKRSRDEAAEKGRQASREWAERQKAKRISQAMSDASPRGNAFL